MEEDAEYSPFREPSPPTVESLKEELFKCWKIICGLRSREGPKMSPEMAAALGAEMIADGGKDRLYTNMCIAHETPEELRQIGRHVEVIYATDFSLWVWDVPPFLRQEKPPSDL